LKITLIQTTAGSDKDANVRKVLDLVDRAIESERPDLVVLPELCTYFCTEPSKRDAGAEGVGGPYTSGIAELAARTRVNLHVGSILERRDGRYFNTSVLYDRQGRVVARYSKIHRFDVRLPNGFEARESAVVDAGTEVVVAELEGLRIGLSICYDLRFGELYRQLVERGAELIVVPSAFLQNTGIDHWEPLLKARAIETQCYVAAPNQIGPIGDNGPPMFGNSLVVDPWGTVIARASHQECFVSAQVQPAYLTSIRQRMPVASHRVLK
jgi:predicted amidohydrolase